MFSQFTPRGTSNTNLHHLPTDPLLTPLTLSNLNQVKASRQAKYFLHVELFDGASVGGGANGAGGRDKDRRLGGAGPSGV